MLVNRQIVYVTCDVRGCSNRQLLHKGFIAQGAQHFEAYTPDGWICIADFVICPKHDVTLHVDGAQEGTLRPKKVIEKL